VGSDSARQSVVHRPDLDLGLEHPKAPLNIGQRLVTANDVLGAQIGCIGHQQQFAIHQARMCQGFVIYRVAKQFTFEVHLHYARQMGLAHLMKETRSCAPIRQLVRILATVTDRSGDRDRFAAVWSCAVKL
jgi:hypothetical protein